MLLPHMCPSDQVGNSTERPDAADSNWVQPPTSDSRFDSAVRAEQLGVRTQGTKDVQSTKLVRFLVDDMIQSGEGSLSGYTSFHHSKLTPWFINLKCKTSGQYGEKMLKTAWDIAEQAVCNMSMSDLLDLYETCRPKMTFAPNTLTGEESDEALRIIIEGMDQFENFVETVWKVGNRELPKNSSIFILGPPNCGKTLIWSALMPIFRCYAIQQDFGSTNQQNNQFAFGECVGKRAVLMNEVQVGVATAETFKNVLEGQPVQVNVKYKQNVVLTKTPIFMCANKEPCASILTSSKDGVTREINARLIRYKAATTTESQSFFRGRRVFIHPDSWYRALSRYRNNIMSTPTSTDDVLTLRATLAEKSAEVEVLKRKLEEAENQVWYEDPVKKLQKLLYQSKMSPLDQRLADVDSPRGPGDERDERSVPSCSREDQGAENGRGFFEEGDKWPEIPGHISPGGSLYAEEQHQGVDGGFGPFDPIP